jgi:uncharacterized phage-associated protein
MKSAAATSLDVAVWFLDRARVEDTYLQPRKLQCLLFLAQAHFVALHKGRRLMPSVFQFDEGGPMEPNLYRVFENGRPTFMESDLADFVLTFLDAIWRRYAAQDAMRLDQLIARHGKGEAAIERRDGSEIGPAVMRRMFATGDGGEMAPPPKVLRSHTGKPVAVKKWMPTRKSPVS